jgi:hypothetical protein
VRIARSALALLAIGLALTVGSVGGAAAADPIVGVWKFAGGMEVTIAGSGGSFSGTVTKAVTGGSCPHPAGELMWKISGGGGSYTGTHYGFSSVSTCEHEWQGASWTVADGKLNFFDPSVCGSSPCGTLTRVTPPAAAEPRSFFFVMDAKAEATRGARGLDRSYIQSYLSSGGEFGVEARYAEGRIAVKHTFLYDELFPDFTIVADVAEVVRFEQTKRGTSVELALEVIRSSRPSCKPGTVGTLVISDAAGSVKDRVAIKLCTGVLLFLHRSPEPVDFVRVKITKKP